MQHHSSDASLGINHCDEEFTPLIQALETKRTSAGIKVMAEAQSNSQEDKRGRQSHGRGPVQLKLESISDF